MTAHEWWHHRSEIEKGKLQIVPLEDLDHSLNPSDLLRMAASASVCDWLALANDDIFYHPAKLLAQMRRAMLYLSERVNGSPVLFGVTH